MTGGGEYARDGAALRAKRTMQARQAIVSASVIAATLALAGCGGVGGALRGVRGTPDEFLVLPTRPLEMPEDLTALPPPQPGTSNRVDYHPRSEAIAGLTGRPAPAGTANGAALVARAGPRDPAIRAELAAEDVTWRQTHHGLLLERWFTRDPAALTYQAMVLDAPAEFDRLRAQGVQVPAAPPSALDQ